MIKKKVLDVDDDNIVIVKNERNNKKENPDTTKYTTLYRIVKSLLLILAWFSFGINNEIIGTTLEDLRILLTLNYESISLGLVFRAVGYLIATSFSGILYDRLSKYAELLMAISSLLMSIRKFLLSTKILKIF